MQVLWDIEVKFFSVSQLLELALCSLFGSVSGTFTAAGLIVYFVGGKKPPAEIKPTKPILLFFLDAAGCRELGIAFLLSYGFVRMGATSGLQSSQLFILKLRSMCFWASTFLPSQAVTFNPPVVLYFRCTN